jgi:catechol 2,3-dioxygenase-like lactoylglutathione lyase family enzyme
MATQNPRFGFVIEYVKDVEAARTFYRDVLGLKEERYHPTFVQFGQFAIAGDEPLNGTGEPEIYWLVDDAEAAAREYARRTELAMPVQQKPFGKFFAIKDTEDRLQFVLELAANRPSQAVN